MYDDIQEDFLNTDLITDVKIDREVEMQNIKKENEEDLWIIDNNKSFWIIFYSPYTKYNLWGRLFYEVLVTIEEQEGLIEYPILSSL